MTVLVGRPTSFHVAAASLALGSLFAGANWYLAPERASAWASALGLLFVLAVVWGCSSAILRRWGSDAARRDAAVSIRRGVAFAGLMMACALGAKLALALGIIGDPDLSQRAAMVVLGAFLVFTGNAMPKMLTPLTAMRCDGATAQAIQRFAGWTWVLTGMTYATLWLALPVDFAEPVSIGVLVTGMILMAAQIIRLCRVAQREA